ncbi:MAG: Gfo/Idh/MocA family oxidoreductase [Bacteroidota bacterium]
MTSQSAHLKSDTAAPASCLVLGAGSRGEAYASWALRNPGRMNVIGVAEPNRIRRERFSKTHDVPRERQFESWEDSLADTQLADVLVIATPDQLHHGAAMRGLELGYHILLEKPIAPTWDQCREILHQQKKHPQMVSVCHVLRYTSFYRKLKAILDSGALGDLVSVEHIEPVGYWHQAHSFVRGNWARSANSSPMILTKSSHDMDILRWLAGVPCRTVASFGSLKHFRPENAPEGSTERCIEDCAVEQECPYSALKLYLDMQTRDWPVSVIAEDLSYQGRVKALREGPYGRCVYHSDNDVVDHQVVALEFDHGITASFTMSAFTIVGSRRTRVMGTMGEATGDSRYILVEDFRTGRSEKIDTNSDDATIVGGHGGGDEGLVEDLVRAIQENDPSLLSTSLEESLESHLMAFAAERSRLERRTVDLGQQSADA